MTKTQRERMREVANYCLGRPSTLTARSAPSMAELLDVQSCSTVLELLDMVKRLEARLAEAERIAGFV